jgi:hypothetical protein
MSNLEHLIENTLVAMEDDKLCPEDIRKRIQNDINLPSTSLSVDDVWEICQYVKYTWCRNLKNKLNAQLEEARRRETMWANNYAKLLKEITDRMIELYSKE